MEDEKMHSEILPGPRDGELRRRVRAPKSIRLSYVIAWAISGALMLAPIAFVLLFNFYLIPLSVHSDLQDLHDDNQTSDLPEKFMLLGTMAAGILGAVVAPVIYCMRVKSVIKREGERRAKPQRPTNPDDASA